MKANDSIKSCQDFGQWNFMLHWCKRHSLHPTDHWNDAEEAYNEMIKNAKSIPIKYEN